MKQKVAIQSVSDCKGFVVVVVLASYQIDCEVQCSISIVNKEILHFLHKESNTHIMCFILVNSLIKILDYECYATCLLQLYM